MMEMGQAQVRKNLCHLAEGSREGRHRVLQSEATRNLPFSKSSSAGSEDKLEAGDPGS